MLARVLVLSLCSSVVARSSAAQPRGSEIYCDPVMMYIYFYLLVCITERIMCSKKRYHHKPRSPASRAKCVRFSSCKITNRATHQHLTATAACRFLPEPRKTGWLLAHVGCTAAVMVVAPQLVSVETSPSWSVSNVWTKRCNHFRCLLVSYDICTMAEADTDGPRATGYTIRLSRVKFYSRLVAAYPDVPTGRLSRDLARFAFVFELHFPFAPSLVLALAVASSSG